MTTPAALLDVRMVPGGRPEARPAGAGTDPAPRRPARRQPDGARPIYRSTKSYDHSEGLSCCFRQWRAAHSHCRLMHGYALAFRFVFATHRLDQNNWCFDFGGLKPIRAWLHETFDHTMLVAEDDPHLPDFRDLAQKGLVDLRVLPNVGCEATAEYVFDHVSRFITEQTGGRVWLEVVEVKEHGGNSAIYERGPDPAEA
jgi:6-pyruvoyltetrahydropterin/6-carboxytetrahydropterin synthase